MSPLRLLENVLESEEDLLWVVMDINIIESIIEMIPRLNSTISVSLNWNMINFEVIRKQPIKKTFNMWIM